MMVIIQLVPGSQFPAAAVQHPVDHGNRGPRPGSFEQWQHGLADAAKADDDDLFDHADPSARKRRRAARGAARRPRQRRTALASLYQF
ncbi:hypothetical protein [Cupriavidus necator]|uniref:hypothetical protein n=1 Tax=Cupriavidus necator TaxID=106590 RepID=UPI001E4D153B|nr:hypothetical protein [Cupriavidus necator]